MWWVWSTRPLRRSCPSRLLPLPATPLPESERPSWPHPPALRRWLAGAFSGAVRPFATGATGATGALTGGLPAPAIPFGGTPFSPPLDAPGGLPAGGAAGSSGGASGPGGTAPSAGTTIDSLLLPAFAWGGLSGAATDDHVPSGPVADHDISPD